jgi:hypothetical protein
MTNRLTAVYMRNAARCLFSTFFLAAVAAGAADMKLDARLVWGTNAEKGCPNCKPVDPELGAKLHGMLKWKNYFEITNQTALIPLNKTRDLKMSDHCTIHVKNLGGSRVELSCIGEGKPVDHRVETLTPPKWLVWGGDGKENTAWFIALRSEDAKADASAKVISKN